jgi:Tat-targeted selenate reductase subunit YnfE
VRSVDGAIVEVRPDPQARACHRGLAMRAWANSPERLRWPLRRVGPRGSGRFERMNWDDALDLVAGELRRVIATYGNEAVLYTYGTGQSCTTAGPFKRLLNCLGGFLDTYNNYSNAQITHMARFMFGEGPDAEGSDMLAACDAQMILAFGTSPAETRQGGASTRRDWAAAVRRVLGGGGRVVVVDPRRNASVLPGCEWLPVRPGTDAALASALAWELCRLGAWDETFLRRCVQGFDDASLPEGLRGRGLSYRSYLDGSGYDRVEKTAEWAAGTCGVEAGRIRELAGQMAAARPLFVMQGWGPQRRSNGEMTSGAIMALPLVLGQVGKPGTNTGLQVAGGGGRLSRLPKGPNPVRASIPCFLWSDAVLRGHEMTAARDGVRGAERLACDVRCIVNVAGNCLTNQHGDLNRAHDVLADESRCEFVLAVDVELCDSARYADVVLPDLFRLEQPSALDAGTVDPYVTVGEPVARAHFERRSQWDMCRDLAERLGVREAFDEGLGQEEWARRLYEQDRAAARARECGPLADLPPYEEARAQGVVHLPAHEPHVALAAFAADPATHPLATPSGKVELFSTQVAGLLERWELDPNNPVTPVPTYVPELHGVREAGAGRDRGAGAPLQLVGFHYPGRIHSSWGNVAELRERFPQTLWISPDDADARGISGGDEVEVANEFGALRVRAQVTEKIAPGTVGLPQGAWHRANMDGDRVDLGACVNVLTDHRPSPLAKGNPQHSVVCRVRRVPEADRRLDAPGAEKTAPACVPDAPGPWPAAEAVRSLGTAELAGLLDSCAALLGKTHGELPADPWGSLWLDGRHELWGPSTLRLHGWLKAHGYRLARPEEPADHVSLELALAARVALEQPGELAGLLDAFVLPWVPRYLERLADADRRLAPAARAACAALEALAER